VAELVKGRGFGWEQQDGTTRESGDVNRAVLRAAFATHVPAGGSQYTGIPLGNTDYAIIKVANVVVPVESEIARSDVATVQKTLVNGRMSAVWSEFVAAIRAGSDVQIVEKNL
jgi:hypothetical protein